MARAATPPARSAQHELPAPNAQQRPDTLPEPLHAHTQLPHPRQLLRPGTQRPPQRRHRCPRPRCSAIACSPPGAHATASPASWKSPPTRWCASNWITASSYGRAPTRWCANTAGAASARDGGDAWEFDTLLGDTRDDSLPPTPADASRGERGALGLGIRVLEFFGIRVEEKAATKLGRWFEDRKLEGGKPGLHALSLDGAFALAPLADEALLPATAEPLLILLHGTASSTQGSFGKLWAADNAAGRDARTRLAATYAGRAFAFEHRSLTESPVANALALVRRLPKGAQLHLVSHSRGGLGRRAAVPRPVRGRGDAARPGPPRATVRRRPHDRRASSACYRCRPTN